MNTGEPLAGDLLPADPADPWVGEAEGGEPEGVKGGMASSDDWQLGR